MGKQQLGWNPTCACEDTSLQPHQPVPCTVLDPFNGTSSTLVAAQTLGRDAIGIDIGEQYAKMSVERIQAEFGPFVSVTVDEPDEEKN